MKASRPPRCIAAGSGTGDNTPETIAKMNAARGESSSEEGDVDVSRLALPNPQEA